MNWNKYIPLLRHMCCSVNGCGVAESSRVYSLCLQLPHTTTRPLTISQGFASPQTSSGASSQQQQQQLTILCERGESGGRRWWWWGFAEHQTVRELTVWAEGRKTWIGDGGWGALCCTVAAETTGGRGRASWQSRLHHHDTWRWAAAAERGRCRGSQEEHLLETKCRLKKQVSDHHRLKWLTSVNRDTLFNLDVCGEWEVAHACRHVSCLLHVGVCAQLHPIWCRLLVPPKGMFMWKRHAGQEDTLDRSDASTVSSHRSPHMKELPSENTKGRSSNKDAAWK